jgi:membrane-associated protein
MSGILDFLLHLDENLKQLCVDYGSQVYLIFFLIIFAETGLVIFPFLPGDSLLFVIGMLSHPAEGQTASLNIWIVVPLLIAAAFIGDNLNYQIGHRFGQRLISKGDTRFIKRKHIEKTQEFFVKHGGMALVLARWVPIVRTFMPFVAGMGAMKFPAFLFWSAIGATIWVAGCTMAGYFFGQITLVKENFELAMLAIVILSIVPMALKFRKARSTA